MKMLSKTMAIPRKVRGLSYSTTPPPPAGYLAYMSNPVPLQCVQLVLQQETDQSPGGDLPCYITVSPGPLGPAPRK